MHDTIMNQIAMSMLKRDAEVQDIVNEDIIMQWVCPDDIDDDNYDWGSECTIDKDEIITVLTRDNKEVSMSTGKFYRLIKSYRSYLAQVVPDIVYHACWYSTIHSWILSRTIPVFSTQLVK